MLIREAKREEVQETRTRIIEEAIYGCDECGQEIINYPNEYERLTVDVFYHDDREANTLHFCCWKCVLKHLPKIQTDYFISLPHVIFSTVENSKKNAAALIEITQRMFK